MIGWLLVFANISGGIAFLTGPSAIIPGLGFAGPEQQASIMIAARQLGQGVMLAFALLYKNVRTLQFAWLMVIIRESIDLAARLISGQGLSPIVIVVTIVLEIAAFIYLGAIASGHVARYVKSEK